MHPLRPAKPGRIYSEDLNRHTAETLRQGRLTIEGGTVDDGGSGIHLTIDRPDEPFFARLTGESSGKYSWVEVDETLADLTSGRSGTTSINYAQGLNGETGIPAGAFVRMWRAELVPDAAATDKISQRYRFSVGGAAGTSARRHCRVATTANISLSSALENGDTLNGVTLATGDRVLVKDQSAPAENGIYVVAASGAAARATDADSWDELVGALVVVSEGTAKADTLWLCTANAGGTLGSTSVTWSERYPPASTTEAGIVDGGAQSFAGHKTFTSNITSEQVNFLADAYIEGVLDFTTDTLYFGSSDGTDGVTMILNGRGAAGYAGGALILVAGWTSGSTTAYPQLRLQNSVGSVAVGKDGTAAGMTYTSGLWTGGTFSVTVAPGDITGLDEAIDDRIAALLVAGSGISLTYNDGANTLTIASTASGITTLNTLTASTQTFAKTDDTNVTLSISSSTATHTFALGWTGQLAVPRGGTGLSSATAYAVLCGGTTSTGAFQSVASVGTSGQVLTSNGAGALPTFQSLSSLDADLAAIAALTGTGIACRTAADTWALRTLTAGSAVSVSNGSGASGNPTVAVDITGLTAITSGLDVSNDLLLLYDDSATSNKKVALRYIQSLIEATLTPPGLIVPFGGSSVPSGYLACDGLAVSRTTYAALFAAINTAYGAGDSSTTFNLPDLRGRFPLGVSGSHGIGTTGGVEDVTLSGSQIPAHKHQVKSPNGSTMFTTGGGAANNVMSVVSAGISGSNYQTEDNSGGGSSHTNMPPYQAVNWLIKT